MDYIIVALIIVPPIVGILVQERLFERTESLFLVKLLTALSVFPTVFVLLKYGHTSFGGKSSLYFFTAYLFGIPFSLMCNHGAYLIHYHEKHKGDPDQ